MKAVSFIFKIYKSEDKFGSKKGLPGLVKNNQRLEENNQQVFLIDNAPIATHPLLRASGITTQSLLLYPPPSSLFFLFSDISTAQAIIFKFKKKKSEK